MKNYKRGRFAEEFYWHCHIDRYCVFKPCVDFAKLLLGSQSQTD